MTHDGSEERSNHGATKAVKGGAQGGRMGGQKTGCQHALSAVHFPTFNAILNISSNHARSFIVTTTLKVNVKVKYIIIFTKTYTRTHYFLMLLQDPFDL